MLKKILLVIVVVVAALLAFAATRPDTFEVSRQTHVAAPPARVHAILDDFHNFAAWSPWHKLDPAMQVEISGPRTGAGAQYAWSGNSNAGKGSMRILESTPQRVSMSLDFVEPFASSNTTDFQLAPDGDGTRVTWSMHGRHSYMTKLMTMFMSMDAMVGKDFEEGLANLKRVAENGG